MHPALFIVALVLASACLTPRVQDADVPRDPVSSEPTAPRCAPGYEEIPGDACLAIPPNAGTETNVILYLHGMYPADAPAQEFADEARLASAAVHEGFAVLAPRGELGLCDWAPEFARFHCWPTRAAQLADAGRLLARFGPAFVATRKVLGAATVRPWLVGYSNGGYFAGVIAAETRLEVRGLAVVNGGAVEPSHFVPDRAVPSLLIAARHDPVQRRRMERLAELLSDASWPHTLVTREGGHALAAEDIARVMEFVRDHR